MEFRNLSSFLTVAKTLSFTRAAQELNYSQSTVTAQIQTLERELGGPLFERLGKRVALTESGRRLVRYAERLVSLERETMAAVPADGKPAGMLTLGICEWLCGGILPQAIRQMRRRYPEVRLTIRAGSCPDLRRRLSEGVLDLALLADAKVRAPEQVVEAAQPESMVVIAPPSHRLAGKRRVRPEELSGEPFLTMHAGCSADDQLFKAIVAGGGVPGVEIEFAGFEAIKRCVEEGVGLTVGMHSAVRTELERGTLVELPLHLPAFRIHVQLVRHRDKWVSPALAAFMEVVRGEIERHCQPAALPEPPLRAVL